MARYSYLQERGKKRPLQERCPKPSCHKAQNTLDPRSQNLHPKLLKLLTYSPLPCPPIWLSCIGPTRPAESFKNPQNLCTTNPARNGQGGEHQRTELEMVTKEEELAGEGRKLQGYFVEGCSDGFWELLQFILKGYGQLRS